MSKTSDLLLNLHWVDERPMGTVALEPSSAPSLVFDGWLELAAAIRRLTVPQEPPRAEVR